MSALTPEEQQAIKALEQLAYRWPRSLWLFATGGQRLHVMKCLPNGQRATNPKGGFDPFHAVAYVEIPSDGGDW